MDASGQNVERMWLRAPMTDDRIREAVAGFAHSDEHRITCIDLVALPSGNSRWSCCRLE